MCLCGNDELRKIAVANKLVEVLAKAEYAVEMAEQAKGSVHHPGGLWYHAIGMFNAFYSINEELKIRLKNGDDMELKASVEDWWKENEKTVRAFFGDARNVATHRGEIDCQYYTKWEADHWNDTEHPFRSAMVSVKRSKIQNMPALEFLELCFKALVFMRDGILEINRDYKKRGGTKHALPLPLDPNDMFSNSEF